MKRIILIAIASSLLGCESSPRRETYDLISAEMKKATEEASKQAQSRPDAVSAALLPPISIELPKPKKPMEERFSLALNNVPAAQFFMAIASGTRYSMLVHPDVTGTLSANLKDVTLFEALDAIRELYGYDYQVDGTRIYVKPLTLQTRVFTVNYLTANRKGTSDIRVTSGSVSDASTSGASPAQAGGQTLPAPGSGTTSQALNSSKISTTSSSDFWSELKASLEAIVGNKEGRSVVVSPQSGVVVVRAMWDELKSVNAYLKAAQLAVDRQVILEAKILEVQLNDSFQNGINWASFASITGIGDNRVATGFLSPGTSLASAARLNTLTTTVNSTNPTTGAVGNATVTANTALDLGVAGSAAGSLFGLAFQTNNFAALISFLETQGSVHVLSSPRIATLNNQKAVLKVGKDEFFVTNISSSTVATGTTTTTSPSVTVQPFFSGVALDVTPQIDEDGNIILHIHPSVSNVTTVDKPLNLGTAGSFSLPLASSTVSETDSVVRGQDGQIVAIGGLMRQASTSDRSQIPGAGDLPVLGGLFSNNNRLTQKRELVILLKPTIVQGSSTWAQDMAESQRRIQALEPRAGISLETR
ncbi:MAG TPA: pilus (MSHA type) biogenesis protein MshL [Noviherbaspirillum sp.]|uniref:pilus (MSHA type) biogenesis protein MshL n=1 Tax=Noviherbaspirillum sp. TaxID=1926288 RepID=UPI002B46BCA0|nr:pilus (MSHA type) biogenesis protein MshL [Noviherbaspirillum sp.]HJV85659.1 pilus (MSHA type) biogenesis protein MshL [Noviherbaspirillum sp.]